MNKLDSFVFVIFGASGDLTARKLIPALIKLFLKGNLPEKFAILGVSRTSLDDVTFRAKLQAELSADLSSSSLSDQVNRFLNNVYYHSMDPSDAAQYGLLADRLHLLSGSPSIEPNYLFYLATPPILYPIIPVLLAQCGLSSETSGGNWRRIVIEKPYGRDKASAMELDNVITSVFKESQIYRIDHYLGKETVLNMLVFRFANGIFESLWNRNYISYVEITAVENMGVLDRGPYYDASGALRDMLQNHLLELLGVTAMEPPGRFNEMMFRNEMEKVFLSVRKLVPEEVSDYVVRGQYTATHRQKQSIVGYREEQNVAADSRTETFVAMKLFIDNWRWSGVPFYLRTGKAMPTKVSEIVIHFKQAPIRMFENQSAGTFSNKLIIRILPDEGILLQFGLKSPGGSFEVQPVSMDFKYEKMNDSVIAEAYERLLLDCMVGDAMLYPRSDAINAMWEIVDPILDAWQHDPQIALFGYPSGTWGPPEQDHLMEEGFSWSNPCKNLTDTENYCLL